MKDMVFSRYSHIETVFLLVWYSIVNSISYWQHLYSARVWLIIEVAIIVHLIFRYVRLKRLDFRLDDEFIDFFRIKRLIRWDDATKITLTDGFFFWDRLLELGFLDWHEQIKIQIDYLVEGHKRSIWFYYDESDYLPEVANKLISICKDRGIECELAFKNETSRELISKEKQVLDLD